jgi:hypothetical protein
VDHNSVYIVSRKGNLKGSEKRECKTKVASDIGWVICCHFEVQLVASNCCGLYHRIWKIYSTIRTFSVTA